MSGIILCGTGTIVTELAPYLLYLGYDITIVTRDPQKAQLQFGTPYKIVSWEEIKANPKSYFVDCEAVVNCARPNVGTLAKTTVGMKPLQLQALKDEFIGGGVESTQIMAKLCAKYGDPNNTVYLNASAYNHFDFQPPTLQAKPCSDLREPPHNNPPQSFFTQAIRAWEEAAQPASQAGIRVVHLGLGMIIDKKSTGFRNILSLFEVGFGGRIGSGEQQIPMISMDDTLAAIVHCIKTSTLKDYVNIAGFNVKQGILAQELAQKISELPSAEQGWMYGILKRVCCKFCNNFTKPETLIKTGLGIFAELLLQDMAIESEKLRSTGFKFKHQSLADALIPVFKKSKAPSTVLNFRSSHLRMGPGFQPSDVKQAQTSSEDKDMSVRKRKRTEQSSSNLEDLNPQSSVFTTGP